jgi:carbamoylphosphate synthase large subunit
MRVWFNKTFSSISAVFQNLHSALPDAAITIICTHTHLTASAFLFADEYYLEPSGISGEAYLQWCLNFCKRHQIELFWPGKEAALIAEYKHRFEAMDIRVLTVAEPDVLRLLQNKANLYTALPLDAAEIMDFKVVETIADFDRAILELSAKHEKLCIKPAVSVYGLGFRIIGETEGISRLLKGDDHYVSLTELRLGMSRLTRFAPLLVMEYLDGTEWSVDCAGRNGELLCAVQRKKSLQQGHGQIIDHNANVTRMVSHLSRHYRLNGLYNIQFKQGKNGPRLLEINARPSGGIGMACLAGANLAYMALQSSTGGDIPIYAIRYGLNVSQVYTPIVLAATLTDGSPECLQ